MEKKDYFEELEKEKKFFQNEFEDDIVFARFINYMRKALRHKKINYHKHQNFLRNKEQNLSIVEGTGLFVRDSSVSSFFDFSHNYTELNSALEKLTQKQRVVIINYYYKNQSLSKIAKELNMKSNAVKQLKLRAILSLKRYMEERDENNEVL